ncbi:sensor histidine kinase [Desulfosediminicola flagellatus]|uniref:sensor histidine kinase n=1 Tax=Desulfosediminicola flagellatus TaxID=2569541 RepID=UPI0010ABE200|nr:ATP-binding protein [Desulfosediminicola flagellatus]
MLLHRYRIATRIGFVVGVILLMMLVLAVVEMKGLNSIRKSLDDIVGKHYQRLQIAQELRFQARNSAVIVRNVLLVTEPDAKDLERKRFEDSATTYLSLLEKLTKQEQIEEENTIINSVVEIGEVTFGLWRTIAAAENGASPRQGMEILKAEVRSHQWGLLDNLDALVAVEQHLAEETMERALYNYEKTKSVMAMINILAIGAGLFSVAAITASIVSPLREITGKVDSIANGDFSTRIELDQQDEIGRLATHINRMVEKLDANEEELEKYRYHLEELIEWRTGEMNEQRERFISVLIHDLKGPLVPIIGFSRLLINKKELDRSKLNRYLQELHESTTKLATVIEKTSEALRQKRSSFSFDKEPFDIEELLHSVSVSCRHAFKTNAVTLVLNDKEIDEYTSSGEILYSGDISKIRSVLENLIGNAGKYASSRVEISLGSNNQSIRLTVDDDGCGVDESYRQRIFEEYYQAPGSKCGTGVGLYSVKKIVDHYGGMVKVEKAPLGGARFSVILPIT